MTSPSAEDAYGLTAAALGVAATDARRFTTGLHHFVYDVTLADGRKVVMRMAQPSERWAIVNAVSLSGVLRPLGVPLPQLLAADATGGIPWMLLERLAGTDLAHVVGSLPDASLRTIAKRVAAAQMVVATTKSPGRFGYAGRAERAPFERWSEVVTSHVQRSRQRIAAAGLFDLSAVDRLEAILAKLTQELDAFPATPFMHDTTTKNVIVTADGGFSGIVDVDDLCYGDPRYVAALTNVALTAHNLPAHYATYLMEEAGWADDHIFRVYNAAFLLDFMSEHGQRFNDNQRPSSPEERAKLLGFYEAALRDLA